MGGGVLYVLKSGDITCSGEVFRGDWTPDWTTDEDDIVFFKNMQIFIVSDKHLNITVSHVSYICMNKTQCHSKSLVYFCKIIKQVHSEPHVIYLTK